MFFRKRKKNSKDARRELIGEQVAPIFIQLVNEQLMPGFLKLVREMEEKLNTKPQGVDLKKLYAEVLCLYLHFFDRTLASAFDIETRRF